MKRDETGWLIEVDGQGRIEYFGGSIVFPTPDPNKAIRFARSEDADRILLSLKAGEMAASAFNRTTGTALSKPINVSRRWKGGRVAEHMWPRPPRKTVTTKDCGK